MKIYNTTQFEKLKINSINLNDFNKIKINKKHQKDILEFPIIKNILTDADGNHYDGIEINNKIWMASNLQTMVFNNGEEISKKDSWGVTLYYQNTDFGMLYSGCLDMKALAPKGWHVPSLDEWEDMLSFLANDPRYNLSPENKKPFGSDIGRAIASKDGWNKSLGRNSTGCIGNKTKMNNSTGLNIVPCGMIYNGDRWPVDAGDFAYLWTSTEKKETVGFSYEVVQYCIYLFKDNSIVFRNTENKGNLCGIRCVKD